MVADTTTDAKPVTETTAIDWSKVKSEDIPRQLIDKHPHVRELVAEHAQLTNDMRAVHRAYRRVVNMANAVHTVIQGIEDTDTLLYASLSPGGRAIVDTKRRG